MTDVINQSYLLLLRVLQSEVTTSQGAYFCDSGYSHNTLAREGLRQVYPLFKYL
jgi:hypothetical protein